MKRLLFLSLFATLPLGAAEAPFHRGVNLTGWLQTSGPRQIQFTRFTRQDFVNIKSLGCDVVRLPINLHAMTTGAPGYEIDPLFLRFLDQIVTWAEELEIHLLLDNHTFDPAVNTPDDIGDILVPVWTNMAEHYRDRSRFVYYEVLNEPHGISDAKWNAIQKRVIDAIRSVDGVHTIVVGPAGWNGYSNLALMPAYADTNLVYTFHFYDPFLFTHQGAGWADPSLVSLSGVPFPYDAARMPACPDPLKGTWVQGSLSSSYRTDGTVAKVRQLLDAAARFRDQRNARIFCGEFGVYIPNSPPADRVEWYRAVREILEEKGMAWTIWDYTGGFGIFEPGGSDRFETDVNVPVVEALGLNAPEQREPVTGPDSTGFILYDDYIGQGVSESGWASAGVIDFYHETDPADGQMCIFWTGVPQYSNIGFSFRPVKDMTRLVDEGYVLDFLLKGDTPEARLDVRFIDTKTTDPSDHPWRMRMTVDESLAAWDGAWQRLEIPLSDFTEHGSWDNAWFGPQGDFDWAAVDRFEIVSEHHALDGMAFWFDDLAVRDPASGAPDPGGPAASFRLAQNFPNPFNPSTRIGYRMEKAGPVRLGIFDAAGRRLRVLESGSKPAGTHTAEWDGRDDSGRRVSSGLYFCVLEAAGSRQARKMVLLD